MDACQPDGRNNHRRRRFHCTFADKNKTNKKRIGIDTRRFYHRAPLKSVAKKSPMNPGM